MGLVYGDEPLSRGKWTGTPPWMWGRDAVMRAWTREAENEAFLRFMAQKGTMAEKASAREELAVCERRMKRWESHAQFDRAEMLRVLGALRRNWASRGAK